MADDDPSTSSAPLPSPGRRQRAPTITIDTSAVNSSTAPNDMEPGSLPLRALSNASARSDTSNISESSAPANQAPLAGHVSQGSRSSIPELRPASSFDSRESRPTSPHNISSPTSKSNDRSHAYLAVPGLRSRQNSVDSDDASHSGGSVSSYAGTSYGGDTYIPTQSGGSTVLDKDFKHALNNNDIINDKEALKADPGSEADFEVPSNNFAFSPGQLNKLINPKSLSAFYALGGIDGLEKGLRTNRRSGLSLDEAKLDGNVVVELKGASAKLTPEQQTPTTAGTDSHDTSASVPYCDRKRVFKDNNLPVKKGKSLLELMWITYNDKVLILLTAAAVVSLAVGLYQTFGTKHDAANPPVEWVEGVAIIVAILVVVIVGSLNDYQKERQFAKLNRKKQERNVKVVRSGRSQEISVFDIMVGDIVHLEPGDTIPVDGIFIEGHNVTCDESSATGESDLIKKKPAEDVFLAIENHSDVRKMDPFILSGAQVTEGVGTFLTTSTGVNSSYGKTLMSLREDPEVTPLQSKLNTLAEYIAKLGGAAGLLLFVVLFIEFLARLPHNDATPTEKGQEFLNIFIVTVTIIVVAVPEGLPLAVTLALAFATTRMLKDNNLVRHLKACEVMGNATTICSDKTGTLTQNKMTVVAGSVGTTSRFGNDPVESVSPREAVDALDDSVKNILLDSIALNSTAFEGEDQGVQTFIGSKTETALLTFARDFLAMGSVSQQRENAKVTQMFPFDSKRKCMGMVVQLEKGKYRLFVKGASEILLNACTSIIRDPTKAITGTHMTDDNRKTLDNIITSYASRSLRTIGLVYRDFERWPPNKSMKMVDGEVPFEDVFRYMTFLGVVGIQDPLREGVRQAVETCQKAGVVVRMVTGDNVNTAKAIAEECGIYTPNGGGIIMEGPEFRRLKKSEMDKILPRLQVLARSSPEDKRILARRLKEIGETVAVTGDGTNDAPALKTADVGFSMGIAGTEVAKEASDIILMDDNFASIVKAMIWGRTVNDAVKKFLQFQVTVNITAVLLTFVSAVASGSEESVLTAVQLLWVNLIMDTMAALALATDPPTLSVLDRKPEPKSAPLITVTMWKMIIGQSIYQLVITLLIHFGGVSILSYQSQREKDQLPTLVFNTFVWMQIFNQWNNRRLDNRFNVFEGILRNPFFIVISLIMIGGQILIVFVGGKAFNVVELNAAQWAYCIVLGFLSIPVGMCIRLFPDELLVKMVPRFAKSKVPGAPALTVSDEEAQFRFPQPLADVKEELSFLKKVKGGRLNNLKFAMQHPRETFLPRSRSGSRSRANSLPRTPENGEVEQPDETYISPSRTPESRKRGRSVRSRSNSALGAPTVMAGIIAGSIAGWSPIDRSHSDNDSLKFARTPLATEADEERISMRGDEPIITEEPQSIDAEDSREDSTALRPQANSRKSTS